MLLCFVFCAITHSQGASMVNRVRSIFLICLVAGTCFVAPAQDDVKSLQNYLKSANLNLVNPATLDVIPGGLVVSDGKKASYNPSGVSFTPSAPTQQAFYQIGRA